MKLNYCFSIGLLITGLIATFQAKAQTLFTYGNHPVSKAEFLKAFEKNPSANNRQKALEEYLPLYINYKLKVQHGYDQKLDTLPGQKEELYNYRNQLEETFLAKGANNEALVKEAILRSQKDVLIGHISFPFNAADTLSVKQARTMAYEAWRQLKAGKTLETVVNQFSTDADERAAKGVAGWITAFSLPYIYENAVYNAPAGSSPEPVKGSGAFHLFKNIQERPAAGKVKLAQILIWQPGETDMRTKQVADSLVMLLQQGASFEQLAMQNSADRSSFASGGILPEFGVGQYDPEFEAKAFALKKEGDLSAPFKTAHGWHILKLIGKTPPPTLQSDDEQTTPIKLLVMNSDRAMIARENFLQSTMQKMGYKKGTYKEQDLWIYSDSALKNSVTSHLPINKNTVLFWLGKEKITAEQWVLYLRAIQFSTAKETHTAAFETYLKQTVQSHYLKNLELLEPDFKAQMQEFKDANLLFETMSKMVWNAAAADTVGLKTYHKQYAEKYKWEAGAQALMVTAADSLTAAACMQFLQKDAANWQAYASQNKDRLIIDSGRFEKNQFPEKSQPLLQAKTITPLVKNAVDNTFSFAYIFAPKAGGDLRSFDEAKGWVVSDFQQVVEARWIENLKKKYPVKLNQAVWQTLLKVN